MKGKTPSYAKDMREARDEVLPSPEDFPGSTETGQTYKQRVHAIPSCLSDGVFTTAAIDNCDHNPSSTTSIDSFQGFSVTIIQHPGYRYNNCIAWYLRVHSRT
jgi:hypothetical protein